MSSTTPARCSSSNSGATLGLLYKRLFREWGVTIPGGTCPEVGAGGHIMGGGYGPLSRLHGSVVDYLYGVEAVVVDALGHARSVIATREPSDPNRDLWWAHTGGGNFGVVVRYWLRAPDADGRTPPGRLLPRPPSEVLINTTAWSWHGLDQAAFRKLVRNHGAWFERNSAPGSPYCGLFSFFALTRQEMGRVMMPTQMDADTPEAEELLNDYPAVVPRHPLPVSGGGRRHEQPLQGEGRTFGKASPTRRSTRFMGI